MKKSSEYLIIMLLASIMGKLDKSEWVGLLWNIGSMLYVILLGFALYEEWKDR